MNPGDSRVEKTFDQFATRVRVGPAKCDGISLGLRARELNRDKKKRLQAKLPDERPEARRAE